MQKEKKYKGLSWSWMFIIVIVASAIISWATDTAKPMKVEMEGAKWLFADKWINVSKNALSRSDLPAKDVSMIIDSLTAFQQEIYKQLNPQFKMEDSLLRLKTVNPKQ